MRFEADNWLVALWAVPVIGALLAWAILRSRRALSRFVDDAMRRRMSRGLSTARRAFRAAMLTLACAAIALALARPQWGRVDRTVQRQGRDLCFLIDVSRSMLARDLAPTRLDRARLWIQDVLAAARGDRVAIVAFAGEAVVLCPLTHDYGFAATALEALSTESVSRGGTLIGDGIRRCLDEVFDPSEPSFKDIILITDGEDHESFPVEAARKAGEAGVRIIAIGIGDEAAGRPIELVDRHTARTTYLEYKGERVMSRLDARTLREVAAASRDGVYFNVATGTIDLEQVYKRLVRQAEQKDMQASQQERYEDRFQVFIAAALGLLGIAHLVPLRRPA